MRTVASGALGHPRKGGNPVLGQQPIRRRHPEWLVTEQWRARQDRFLRGGQNCMRGTGCRTRFAGEVSLRFSSSGCLQKKPLRPPRCYSLQDNFLSKNACSACSALFCLRQHEVISSGRETANLWEGGKTDNTGTYRTTNTERYVPRRRRRQPVELHQERPEGVPRAPLSQATKAEEAHSRQCRVA